MNKKVYESPAVEVYMMEISMMIATSGNGDGTEPGSGGSTGGSGTDEPELSPGHRGEWGQIWN